MSSPTTTCARCGTTNRADAKFCKGCGQAGLAPTAARCSNASCGAMLEAQDEFCAECGTPVEPKAAPQAAPPPAAAPPQFPDTEEMMRANGLTFKAPDGTPPAPAARNGKPLRGASIVDAAGFDALVRSGRPTLVFFSASWAGPSRQIEPVLETLTQIYGSSLAVAEVDIDDHPDLVASLGVRGVPEFRFLAGGQIRAAHAGGSGEALVSWVRSLVK